MTETDTAVESDPCDMSAEYIAQLTHELYARTFAYPDSQALHRRAMAVKAEVTRRLLLLESYGQAARKSKLSHKTAVRRIASYLRSAGCAIVLTELTTANRETPDVLGFSGAHSVLVEVKVSRADFLADRDKSFRRWEERGMGERRYYAMPKGMIRLEELPAGWGLLEFDGRSMHERKEAEPKTADKQAELTILVSVLRRLKLSTAVFVQQEVCETSGEAIS